MPYNRYGAQGANKRHQQAHYPTFASRYSYLGQLFSVPRPLIAIAAI
jgi:hypothetical protein